MLSALEVEQQSLNSLHPQLKLWTNASLGEALINHTPLTMSLFQGSLENDGAVAEAYRQLGFSYFREPTEVSPYTSICARAYVNLPAYFKAIQNNIYSHFNISSAGKWSLKFSPRLIYFPFQLCALIFRLAQRVPKQQQYLMQQWSDFNKSQRQQLRKLQEIDLQKLDTESLKSYWLNGLKQCKPSMTWHLQSDILSVINEKWMSLLHFCLGLKTSRDELAGDPKENFISQCHVDLWKLAHGKMSWDLFENLYQHRGFPDWELSSPRWMRTNSELKNLVLAHTNQPDPSLKLHTFYQERLQRQSLLLKAVQRFPRRLLQDFYVNSLKSYQFILAARENTKSLAISWISIQGALTRELAKRLNWGDEIFYLSSLEIKSLLAEHNSQGSLQQEAIYRRKIWQELKRLPLPNQIYANNISELGKFKKPQQERTRLAGTQISGGHIQGRAVLIDSNTDFFVLSKKDILVMPFAEASKSSWMSLAGGLIMEQGGQLSHTALLARERAVPALVGVKEACQQLRTGDLIELDANNCEVRVLERNYYDQHSP